MGTATKTGPSTGFILGMIILVGAGVFFVGKKLDFQDDRTERVTVGVAFDPNQRPKSPVDIRVSVDNTDIVKTSVKSSPWSKTITVPKGAQVSVYAYQEIRGALNCTILAENKQVDTNSRADAGSVHCWHNRKK